MGTVKKLTLENMDIAFGILSKTRDTPGGSFTPFPPIATYVLKNTIATLGLINLQYVYSGLKYNSLCGSGRCLVIIHYIGLQDNNNFNLARSANLPTGLYILPSVIFLFIF